ncbi:MAG: glycosyltransferase family 9 protein [Selenomonadaceae bacterium]|nr:glycosyltransferase family 9 protein [Selenomonadaceae bacterium]
MKKICIMHQASIGDTLMATPVYRAIKECYLECKTVVVTSHVGYELLYGNPHIDTLLPYKKGDDVLTIIKNIWRSEAAVIFDYHYRNAFYAFLALIPKRIGYGKDFINVRMQDEPLEMFEPLKYLSVVKQLGIHTEDLTLTRPYVSKQEKERVISICDSIRKPSQKLILIVPFSMSSIKDWEPVKYREIIRRLKELDCVVAMTGGVEQIELINKEFPDVVNFAGKLNLRESAELIAQADLQICGCTAMLHVCSTTDTPSVAIYGPTIPEQWAPRKNCKVITHRIECSPCYNIPGKPPCTNNRCIKEIEVDEVWNAVQQVIC